MKSYFRLLYPMAAVSWTAVVFYVCLMPASAVPAVPWMNFPLADKLVHFLLFGILCWLYLKAGMSLTGQYTWKGIYASALLSTCLGVLIEYLQATLVNGRSFEYLDILADTIGIAAVVIPVSLRHWGNKN